ncbi:MAG: hypothetical protein R6X25_01105 [Candidatus Krumholzibacteriia bacterium]
MTGYRLARALGKDPTGVYRALDDLKRRGAVELVPGRKESSAARYWPVEPELVIRDLEREYRRRSREAARGLAPLKPRPDTEEVHRLHDRDQVLDRFGLLLDECRYVALLDLAPELLLWFRGRIERAVGRGVTVLMKLYREPPRDRVPAGVHVVIDPQGDLALKLAPGLVLHGVFDCSRQLVTYLPRLREAAVAQAFWTANLFLAFQAHSGLANEIMATEMRAMLAQHVPADRISGRADQLESLAHGSVDWQALHRAWASGRPE